MACLRDHRCKVRTDLWGVGDDAVSCRLLYSMSCSSRGDTLTGPPFAPGHRSVLAILMFLSVISLPFLFIGGLIWGSWKTTTIVLALEPVQQAIAQVRTSLKI